MPPFEISELETPPPPFPEPAPLHFAMAGLESGILGGALMIGWFALDSLFEHQYWWAILNLWGSAVYQNRVFSMGLGIATVAGAATHFFLHGTAGAIWALAAGRLRNQWVHLAASFAAAALWFVTLHYLFWPIVSPVVPRASPMPATLLAYILFGAALSRNPFRANQLHFAWKP
ncbi:MAG: hypothetical protein FJW32_13545 [Acidobacteria bacterium]|nr:hypothetical protein [Acidobacteriota bacterium]